MESNIGEDGGSNAVQDVIQRLAGIDQVDLLPSIGDQDQPRYEKRRDPPNEANFPRALSYGAVQAKLRQDARHSGRKWTIHRTPAGTLMPAAAEALRHGGHVQLAFAAQADTKTTVSEFAEEGGDLDSLYRERIVHQAFAILIQGAAVLHLPASHPDPGERPFPVQVGKGCPQQPHL